MVGKVAKVKGGEEAKQEGVREQMQRAVCGQKRNRRERKGPVHSLVRSFVRSYLAYRSRGPGRTILLDLCARAIACSSRSPSTESYERRRDCSFVRE